MGRAIKKPNRSASLMVRLDPESKKALTQAAALRRISVSDYVRMVTVAQARKEVSASEQQIISMTPEDQLAFWNALSNPPKPTPAQIKLGKFIRGEA